MAYDPVAIEGRRHAAVRRAIANRQGPAFQAYSLLYFGFIVAPLVAGIDKFFHYLVDWNIYLSPAMAALTGGRVDLMMQTVGIVEILAGVLVALKPRLGALIVAFWLWAIIVNLAMIPAYFDIALRDFGLSLGALALWRLSAEFRPA